MSEIQSYEVPLGFTTVVIVDTARDGAMIVMGVNRGFGIINTISDATHLCSLAPETAGRINVYFRGDKLVIQNNTGLSRALRVVMMLLP